MAQDRIHKEAVLSLGAMYKPAKNLKVTAAITSELKHAVDTGNLDQAAKSNGFSVNLHYAL